MASRQVNQTGVTPFTGASAQTGREKAFATPRGPAQVIMTASELSTLIRDMGSIDISKRRTAATTLVDMILRTDGDPKTKTRLLREPFFVCIRDGVPLAELLRFFDRTSELELAEVGFERASLKVGAARASQAVERWAKQHGISSQYDPMVSTSIMWSEMREQKLPPEAVFLALIRARGLYDGMNDLIDFFQANSVLKDARATFSHFMGLLLPVHSHRSAHDAELREFLGVGQRPREERETSKSKVSALVEKMGMLLDPESRPARAELFARVTASDGNPDQKTRLFLGMAMVINSDRARLVRSLMESEASSPMVRLALDEEVGVEEAARLVGGYLKDRGRNETIQGGRTYTFDPEGLGSCIPKDALRKLARDHGHETAALVAMRVHGATEGATVLVTEVLQRDTANPLPSPPELFWENVLLRKQEPILHGLELGAAVKRFLGA